MIFAIVSPIAGHCGTRGRQSTSVSCSRLSSEAGDELVARIVHHLRVLGPLFHSDSRFTPERLPGPLNAYEVRICVSSQHAHWM